MVDITAAVITDSIGEHSPRLVTMLTRYPKFVHSEHTRHRSFSFSVSSSRAIPVAKNLEEVRSDELRAAPVWWGREQRGMQSGEELDDSGDKTILLYTEGTADYLTPRAAAERMWRRAAHDALSAAINLQRFGAHKSIVNRILEPFLHVNVLVTGTESGWMNFFGLRLDKAAQPEIRALAEAQWRCWNESKPRLLRPGEWHLPFIDLEYRDEINRIAFEKDEWQMHTIAEDLEKKVSTACCAHLSYESFETGRRMTVSQCVALHERLVGSSPIHASPAEHQATPDQRNETDGYSPAFDTRWWHPEQAGNLGPGWRQYRKMLPGEAIAPLPEAYR